MLNDKMYFDDFSKKIIYVCSAVATVTFAVVLSVWYAYVSLLAPVSVTDINEIRVRVEEGMTGASIGNMLEAEGVIRSSFAFRAVLKTIYPDVQIQAGTYVFTSDAVRDIFAVIEQMKVAPHTVKLIFPEGVRGQEIFDIISENMSSSTLGVVTARDFDAHIGYLFPDTYSFDEAETATDIIERMQARYKEVIAEYKDEIAESGFTENEIIILASLLEREADDEESMKHVSGILRNRLEDGMRLQIDATLHFIFNKTSTQLTKEDLASSSPYNTYQKEGLPPGPIANPGRMAIEAALHPLQTNDLFYLTGSDGTFHYSQTFEQHKQNKAMYLR